MPSAAELFNRFPTPLKLECAVIDGRRIRPGFAAFLGDKFEGTPLALALERVAETNTQPDGTIFVDDFRNTIENDVLSEYGRARSIRVYDNREMEFNVYPGDKNANWMWRHQDNREPVQQVAQAALAVKGLVQTTHPELLRPIAGNIDPDNQLGFDVTLIPEIPEGVFIIKESGIDNLDGNADGMAVTLGSILYEQWTVVDTRSGVKEKTLLFMGIIDDRTADGEGYAGMFHSMYWVIPELGPIPHEELQYNVERAIAEAAKRMPGERRQGILPYVPHVFGHLPQELTDLPEPTSGRKH